ncbi:hypothetical protein VTN31DRAFT_7029 [Thermomyces dupontii]|uniref:uncharacterized protein n=1 Tax=Talaromyces thermophilus TaxID=28565 RepID=UPI0037436D61
MDRQSPAPRSAIPRRGPQLSRIRTDLPLNSNNNNNNNTIPTNGPSIRKSQSQRLRPTVPDNELKVPLQPDRLKRDTSKSNLRGLFTRSGKNTQDGETQSTSSGSDARSARSTGGALRKLAEKPSVDTISSSALLGATGMFVVDIPTSSSGPVPPTPPRPPPLKKKDKPKDSESSAATSWSPPPLFQAYPQAVKHACLSTPVLSAESILRMHASRTANSEAREHSTLRKNSASAGPDRKHVRKTSGSISKTQWTKKIFVLVTSGRLLQYAVEGNSDRLPEKILRLGPASAAFASDALPGKPWVIQVSHASSDEGKIPTPASQGFFSRIGIQSGTARRVAGTIFLVFTNPEEMESWLNAIRKMIASLGGTKFEQQAEEESQDSQPQRRQPVVPDGSQQRSDNVRRSFVSESPQTASPSPSLQALRRSPASASARRKGSYQDGLSNSNNYNMPKAFKRRSITVQNSLDTISVSTSITTLGDADTVYENPRDAPLPPSSPNSVTKFPPLVLEASPPVVSSLPVLTPSVSSDDLGKQTGSHRQSLYAYPSVHSDRQVKVVERRSRPRSLISDAVSVRDTSSGRSSPAAENMAPVPRGSSPPPNFSLPSFAKRQSIFRKGSAPSQSSVEGLRGLGLLTAPSEESIVTTPHVDSQNPAGSQDQSNNHVSSPPSSPRTTVPVSLSGSRIASPNTSSPKYRTLPSISRLQSPDSSVAPQSRPSASDTQRNGSSSIPRTLARFPKPGDLNIPNRTSSIPQVLNPNESGNAAAPLKASGTPPTIPRLSRPRPIRTTSSPESKQGRSPSSSTVNPAAQQPIPTTTTSSSSSSSSSSISISPRPIPKRSPLSSDSSAPSQQPALTLRKGLHNMSLAPPAPPPNYPLPEVPAHVVQYRSALRARLSTASPASSGASPASSSSSHPPPFPTPPSSSVDSPLLLKERSISLHQFPRPTGFSRPEADANTVGSPI